jgi:4-amino-4-deoxy-L-arabinose transferase-like glycosyltransferase
LMKVLPFHYTSDRAAGFWSRAFQPDFLISLLNQLLLFLIVFLLFKLAKRLFDSEVAWVSALALLGTELLWRFSVSGLSTMLLMLILVGLGWTLVLREEWGRDEACGSGRLLWMGAAIGALVGVGVLTRYSFAFVMVPVVLFLALFAGRLRAQTVLCALAAFALVLTPWVVRNYQVSGHAFGIASYALVANTSDAFSGNHLERSLQPQLLVPALMKRLLFKLSSNIQPILESDLPKLGGTWISAFFLVGLMIGFKREGPRRLRYFLLACMPVFVLVQALGRTYLSDDSPELNTENLLVLLTPFAIVFGVSLFFLLLDQVQLPAPELRYIVIGLFLAVASLPLLLVFLSPTGERIALPYFPKFIQLAASEVKEKELTMSDIPWAVAWYGRRDCIWLTLNPLPPGDEPSKEDLLAVNDYLKPIAQLYLSPVTIDRKPLNGDKGWADFVLSILVNRELPPPDKKFPLTTSLQSMDMVRQGHLVLMPRDLRLRNAVQH